jgi:hypothetical protein
MSTPRELRTVIAQSIVLCLSTLLRIERLHSAARADEPYGSVTKLGTAWLIWKQRWFASLRSCADAFCAAKRVRRPCGSVRFRTHNYHPTSRVGGHRYDIALLSRWLQRAFEVISPLWTTRNLPRSSYITRRGIENNASS